jgi:hypothetical protein
LRLWRRAIRENQYSACYGIFLQIIGSFGEFMGKLFLKPAAGSLRAPQVAEWVAQLQRLGSAEGKWTAEYRRQEG